MIKGPMHQKDLIINIHSPKNRGQNYRKQKLTEVKGTMDHSTIAGDFNVPFSIMDKPTRQKMNKEIEDLNNTIYQLNLIGMYGTLYPMTEDIQHSRYKPLYL